MKTIHEFLQEGDVAQVQATLKKGIYNESWLRRRAMKSGYQDYVSVRPCDFHGITARDLKGACLKCLADGRSRNQAKR